MDKRKYRVAIASTDGIVVNQHFGRAEEFYIFEVERWENREANEDKKLEIHRKEKRKAEPVCQGGNHDQDAMEQAVHNLADCDYVLVERAGMGACQMLKAQGIEVFELPGMIEESVRQLDRQLQIQELFD